MESTRPRSIRLDHGVTGLDHAFGALYRESQRYARRRRATPRRMDLALAAGNVVLWGYALAMLDAAV